ncbi:MAG: hypothetical protein Q9161_006638 [Pseudevernia consocians]
MSPSTSSAQAGWEASVEASVPESVQDGIFFDRNLEYMDSYAYLSTKSALVPAFSKEDYLTMIASSLDSCKCDWGNSVDRDETDVEVVF